MAEDGFAVNGVRLGWLDQAWDVWVARLSSAVEAGGVSLSESDCQNLLAVLLNGRLRVETKKDPIYP